MICCKIKFRQQFIVNGNYKKHGKEVMVDENWGSKKR